MIFIKIVFWVSLFFLFYGYIGYAILTYILIKIRGKNNQHKVTNPADYYQPSVTLLVAAYNEAGFIEEKITNTFLLDYPKEKLQLLFVTDGSNDGTENIIKQFDQITLLHQPERKGKSAALNRALPYVRNDIVIICDANTHLNKDCIKELAKHYSDPTVGGVSGEKKILSEDGLTKQEGLYWKYESFLKKLDAEYYTIVGAAGELFSFRKHLWVKIPEDSILDDFMISMFIVKNGHRILYEPNSYAIETASASVKDEAKRKVRIAAGGFQSMGRLLPMLNIFTYGKASFLYISHRVLRWAICPFCLLFLIITNIILVLFSGGFVYQFFFVAQVAVYGLILLNWLLSSFKLKIPLIQPLQYFVFMNICVIRGFFRFLKGKQAATWERAERQVMRNPTANDVV